MTGEQTPAGQLASETARLRRLGFVAGGSENLENFASHLAGLSIVEEFSSASGARSELANQSKQFKTSIQPGGHYASFTVKGIRGAQGFGATGPGSSGINIAFSVGRYFYLVGEGSQGGGLSTPALSAAANRLYHRVGG